jgi:hypothetical protein
MSLTIINTSDEPIPTRERSTATLVGIVNGVNYAASPSIMLEPDVDFMYALKTGPLYIRQMVSTMTALIPVTPYTSAILLQVGLYYIDGGVTHTQSLAYYFPPQNQTVADGVVINIYAKLLPIPASATEAGAFLAPQLFGNPMNGFIYGSVSFQIDRLT